MLKRSLYLLCFVFFISIYASIAKAASISPDPVGNLNIDEVRQVQISALNINTYYIMVVQKVTGAVPIITYSNTFSECYRSDPPTAGATTGATITKDLGPYSISGLYKLELYKVDPNVFAECKRIGNALLSKEFSVGGPNGRTCCEGALPIYDRGKDICKRDPIDLLGELEHFIQPMSRLTPSSGPTNCKQSGTYCEPDSLQCFASKTKLLGEKICKNPNDSDFDPAKHAVCGQAAGNTAPGCTDDPTNPGVATVIGCVRTNPTELVKNISTFIIGIGGGIAFLMMLLGAFQMLTSAGNPEALQAGRERLTSAIIGLLFIIFATLLLQVIGFDILKLPGFGR